MDNLELSEALKTLQLGTIANDNNLNTKTE
jgi:hypothetical protein